jgi:hypothetical protein
MRIVTVDQPTSTRFPSSWVQAHCGVVSGSGMKSVLDFTKVRTLKSGETRGGEAGEKRKTYFRMKLAELLTGIAVQDHYVSKDMLDGIEREPSARRAYELQSGVLVEEIGFALHDEIPRFGGSVDGLVDEGGLVEIKCPRAGTHLQWLLEGKLPDEHLPQVSAYLSITGRPWCDFVSWCPFVPKALQLMVVRIQSNPAMLDIIETAVRQFNAEVDEAIERLRGIVGPFDLPAASAATTGEERDLGNDPMDPLLGISDEDILVAQPNWNELKMNL